MTWKPCLVSSSDEVSYCQETKVLKEAIPLNLNLKEKVQLKGNGSSFVSKYENCKKRISGACLIVLFFMYSIVASMVESLLFFYL